MTDLADRLQILRKEANYSQEQLADMLSISRQALSKWENGQANPDVSNVIKLSKIYNKTTDYLLLGEESKPATIYQEKIVYREKTGFKKLYDLPRSFRIALAMCGTTLFVFVVIPFLITLLF